MKREPAVADQFYPADKPSLTRQIESFMKEVEAKEDVMGVVSPHAGYIYSGRVAGAVFSRINIPEDVVILGPNHRGYGADCAIMTTGTWNMPHGPVEINSTLAHLMVNNSRYLADDYKAHLHEHSLEVQVPFIQYVRPDFRLVPITMAKADFKVCEDIGLAIAKAIRDYGKKVLMVASTDMTHYESQKDAERKDHRAIKKILELDAKGLLETVMAHDISMCGVIPTTIVLVACKTLGATQAHLIEYATSGDITGDYFQVVGYAGLIIK
ncbi:MAG TPA: AmmeMemoRadiSam system protein B [Syntrophaceae bacterium]|nr:AmmeMemoRadiSam system protein B [Syntrophaceae bacterium]